MQGIADIWHEEGVYLYERGIPLRLRRRIVVSSTPSDAEVAAMLELTSRIGIQILQLPDMIFEGLFVEEQFDVATGSANLGAQVVLGYGQRWLRAVSGSLANVAIDILSTLPHDAGLVLFSAESQTLTVTGTTPFGVLRAARYLTTEGFGQGLEAGTCARILPENESHQSEYPHIKEDAAFAQSEQPVSSDYLAGRGLSNPHSLHDLINCSGLYQNSSGLYPEFVGMFAVKDTTGIHKSMVSLCARLLLEATAAEFPVTLLPNHGEAPGSRVSIHFEREPSCSGSTVVLQEDVASRNNELFFKAPTGTGIQKMIEHILSTWFDPLQDATFTDWRSKVAALHSTHPDILQRAVSALQLANHDLGSATVARVPAQLAPLVRDSLEGLGVTVQEVQNAPLWQANWRDTGELVDLEYSILKLLTSLDPILLEKAMTSALLAEVFTTVSRKSFQTWSKHISRRLDELNLPSVRLVHRNAHKSGLHWFLDSVLPDLRHLNVHHLVVEAREFSPVNFHLDLPQRFLQELFPLDAIVSRDMGLPIERIALSLHTEKDGPMFRITAFDKENGRLNHWSWEGWVHSIPYSPNNPDQGLICTPLAGIRLYQSGMQDFMVAESLLTNAERFWHWYQGVVEKLPDRIGNVGNNPKFFRLDCHVTIDADELNVGVHEELSSLPEALHEDVYFYTLDALNFYGKSVRDNSWQSPGAVIPFIHMQEGAPHALVQIHGAEISKVVPLVLNDGSQENILLDMASAIEWGKLAVREVYFQDDQFTARVQGLPSHSLSEECEVWLNKREKRFTDSSSRYFTKDLDGDVLQNEDVAVWLHKKAETFPGLFTIIDRSFLGAPIYCVELYHTTESSITCRNKQALYKPTVFINARHHANEVSSTNAALRLIAKLTQTPVILAHLNLVIIPLQNVDGADVHKQLLVEHPTWKHHSARYNACGFEFARDYFNDRTQFGESRTYQRVWETWHPDIIVDDHGIPSHEWIQPFAGYNSPPTFPVSYWIPCANMYTIWNILKDADSERLSTQEALVEQVSQSIAKSERVRNTNSEFLARFIRWGHNFAPAAFPLEVSGDVLSYRWSVERDPNSSGYLTRFPELVTADLITEVNDETVHGDSLAACADAHLSVHEGIMNFVSAARSEVSLFSTKHANGTVTVGQTRQRPLQVAGKPQEETDCKK